MNDTNQAAKQTDALRDPVWEGLRAEAASAAAREPVLAELIRLSVLDCRSLEEAISHRLSRKLGHHALSEPYLFKLFIDVTLSDPRIGAAARADIRAVAERDAACKGLLAPFLYFKGFQVLCAYRIGHRLWMNGREEVALYLRLVSQVFSVESIPPRDRTGIMLTRTHRDRREGGRGRTAFQLHDVSLGGTGKEKGATATPRCAGNVLIGAGTRILGNIGIGEGARIGAGSVVWTTPAAYTAWASPARHGCREDGRPAWTMDNTSTST
jgi:serine O-acetyltransferase